MNFKLFIENEDANYVYFEKYDEILYNIINTVSSPKFKKGTRIKWHPMPLNRLTRIWQDFMSAGIVRDERGIDEIGENFLDKIITLDVSTMLSGHSTENPAETVKEKMEVDFASIEDKLYDYLVDPSGSWLISDYGLIPLQKAALAIMKSKDHKEKLLAIDSVLNVVHQRSNLSKLFVVGGRMALDQLSGK